MSSKLVRKALQRNTTDVAVATDVGYGDRRVGSSRWDGGSARGKRRASNDPSSSSSSSSSSSGGGGTTNGMSSTGDGRGGTASRERVESMLRLDDAMTRYASSTTRMSFARKSNDDARGERRRVANRGGPTGASETAALSNSRGSASSFALLKQPRRYDKDVERRRREEEYLDGLSRTLEVEGRKGRKRTKK